MKHFGRAAAGVLEIRATRWAAPQSSRRVLRKMAVLFCVPMLVASSCQGGQQSGGESADQQQVRFGIPNPTFNLGIAAWPVAKAKGYFRAAGVQPKFQFSSGTPPAIQALAAGSADIAFVDTQSLNTSIAKGVTSVRAVCTIAAANVYSVVVPQRSSIRAPRNLKSKTIAVPSIGSGAYVNAVALVRGAGLDPTRDVKFVPIEAPEAQLTALRQGRVDAIGTFDTIVGTFKAQGMSLREFQPESLAYQWSPLAANIEFLRDHPDAVAGMCKAVLQGTAYTVACPQAAVDIYRKQGYETPPTDEAIRIVKERADAAFKAPHEGDDKWGWVPTNRMNELAKTYVKLRVMDRYVPVKKHYTNELSRKIQFDVKKVQSDAQNDGGC